MEREPASVKKDTHDCPHGATNLHPTGTPFAELLEGEPPSSAQARADKFIRALFDALDPGLHSGVRIVGQTNGKAGRDTRARLGTHGIRSERSDALHGGWRNTHAPQPQKPEHGQILELWRAAAFSVWRRLTASLLLRFAALHRRSLMTPTARLAPPGVDSQVAGPSRGAEKDPQFQQPSTQESFSLDIGATKGPLGRDDQALSVARKGDDFGRLNHLLDHCRLAAPRRAGPSRPRADRPCRTTCLSRTHWRTCSPSKYCWPPSVAWQTRWRPQPEMNLEVHHGNSRGTAAFRSQSEQVPHINGIMELLKVPLHRRRGFTPNDANFLKESSADGELQGAAASDPGIPETRPADRPMGNRDGAQRRPLATTWLGQTDK